MELADPGIEIVIRKNRDVNQSEAGPKSRSANWTHLILTGPDRDQSSSE